MIQRPSRSALDTTCLVSRVPCTYNIFLATRASLLPVRRRRSSRLTYDGTSATKRSNGNWNVTVSYRVNYSGQSVMGRKGTPFSYFQFMPQTVPPPHVVTMENIRSLTGDLTSMYRSPPLFVGKLSSHHPRISWRHKSWLKLQGRKNK